MGEKHVQILERAVQALKGTVTEIDPNLLQHFSGWGGSRSI